MVIRPRPTPEIDLVFHPQRDQAYVHFENGDAHPFDPAPGALGRRKAWWLAEAALLTYWTTGEVTQRYARTGFETEPIFSSPTQSYVAWNDSASSSALPSGGLAMSWMTSRLRSTSGNVRVIRAPGFKLALERVMAVCPPRCAVPSRTVWFTGHGLRQYWLLI
jgi:hypothetical protein